MAIDTSMYQNLLRPPKSVAEYDAERNAGQLAQRQNRLAEMMLSEKQRGIEQANAKTQAYQGAFNPATGKMDSGKLRGALGGMGDYEGLQAIDQADAAQATAQRTEERLRLSDGKAKMELIGQVIGSAKDQGSYAQGIQTLAGIGVDVSGIPPQYDPAYIQQASAQVMTASQQIEQVWKQKGYDLEISKFGETKRHNRVGEVETARGHTLTDTRTRDLNETKVEENRIKREAKDDTTKLTKSSQIASFDTMLGTLDRLGKHPGLARSVGLVGALPTMPGSDSANFQAELNTFQSQAFLPMVAQLKGMGALSDAEGKKLTAAVGALDPKMGEDAFRKSVKRITEDMEAARRRMAGTAAAKPSSNTAKDGATGKSKSGKPIVMRNGQWEYQ